MALQSCSNYFDRRKIGIYTTAIEVQFTPEEEAQLAKIATLEGVPPEQLVKDAALRIVADDSRFLAGVRRGLAQADRDEFIEEAEMDTRVKRLLER